MDTNIQAYFSSTCCPKPGAYDVLLTVQPTPSASGNTTNLNCIFKDANGDTWIVDSQGDAIMAGSAQIITTVINTILGHKIADYTNELGAVVTINESITSLKTFSIADNIISLEYVDEAGVTTSKTVTVPSDVVTAIANTITGHKIGDYTNESGANVVISETITSIGTITFNSVTGVLTIPYTDEAGVINNKTVTLNVATPSANWTNATTDPTATGNTGTLPRFVNNTANGSKWYVDANGVAFLIEGVPTANGVNVYFNSTDPATATIFDDVNPPITNDNTLKANSLNTYISSVDGSVWSWNGTSYITKVYNSPIDQSDVFTATANQTAFTLSKTPIGKIYGYRNGVKLPTAFTWIGTAVTYVPANNGTKTIDINDVISFEYLAY